MDTFYQLYSKGVLVYEGITERDIEKRIKEHISDKKDFDEVSYVDDLKNRRASRNLEGPSLDHNRGNKKMLNSRRNDGGFYHSYDKEKIESGNDKTRSYYTKEEIEEIMSKGKRKKVDSKGNLTCNGK